MSSNERMIITILLGYIVIFNLIGSSRLEFYPTKMLIGGAFGIGIAMVIGTGYYFLFHDVSKKMLKTALIDAFSYTSAKNKHNILKNVSGI